MRVHGLLSSPLKSGMPAAPLFTTAKFVDAAPLLTSAASARPVRRTLRSAGRVLRHRGVLRDGRTAAASAFNPPCREVASPSPRAELWAELWPESIAQERYLPRIRQTRIDGG